MLHAESPDAAEVHCRHQLSGCGQLTAKSGGFAESAAAPFPTRPVAQKVDAFVGALKEPIEPARVMVVCSPII